jgi:hypothetical protein
VTKATGYALVPGAMLALAVAARRARTARLGPVAGAGAALALTLGAWFVIARVAGRPAAAQVADATGAATFNLRQFLSYLWQYYLPHLPFQTSFDLIPGPNLPLYDIWLTTGWAAFGWLEVRFPDWVYVVLTAVTVVVAGVALAGLWRARRRVDLAVVGFLALVAATLIAGLHWTEYHMLISGRGPFNNARYLLPVVGLAGLAVAQAVRALRPAARAAGVAGVLAALLVLDVFSLGLSLERFYA